MALTNEKLARKVDQLENRVRSGFKTSSKAHWRRYTKSSKCSHIIEYAPLFRFSYALPSNLTWGFETTSSDHDELLIELVREIRKLIDTPKPKGGKRSIGFIMSDKSNRKS